MKYYKLVLNARNPKGFWGKMMIRSMNKGHYGVTGWGLNHIDIEEDFTILDVGCGGGKTVSRLSKTAVKGKVYGIDYSQLAVKKSKKFNKKAIKRNQVQIDEGSVSKLPYIDNMFDLVTAVETYYFWPDKINDLKEIYRVLKPKGKLLLVFEMCKNESEPDKWAEVEKLAKIKAVSEQEIRNNLLKAGFLKVRTYTKENTSWLCAIGQKE
ncbi:MAG: class I SAM-dependent methyltransferase [Oscillospiraceae bacterium]|nr:class I SAM-dependent methyltransferase [Oscillospiraceae bacterium]